MSVPSVKYGKCQVLVIIRAAQRIPVHPHRRYMWKSRRLKCRTPHRFPFAGTPYTTLFSLSLSLYSLSSPVSSYRFCPLLRQLLHLSSRSGTSSCTEPSLFSSSLSFLSIFPFTISTPRRSTLPPTPRHRQRPFFFFFSSSSTIQQPYHLDSIACNLPFIRFMPY